MKFDDWTRQFDGINLMRRITQHHSELLTSSPNNLHAAVNEVLKLVENLRSSLSKNAMICMTEMCEKLRRSLDGEIDVIATRLLRKGCDSNTFITEEVRGALLSICWYCSEVKIA